MSGSDIENKRAQARTGQSKKGPDKVLGPSSKDDVNQTQKERNKSPNNAADRKKIGAWERFKRSSITNQALVIFGALGFLVAGVVAAAVCGGRSRV